MKLIIHVDFAGEEIPTEEIKGIIEALSDIDMRIENKMKIALLRDGDRSAKNCLLPTLEGRLGNHLQDRKATLEEAYKFLCGQTE